MLQNTNLPKVCILLSSYNGREYIKEQIDSLLAQEAVNVEIVIRDDGSTDETPAIIEEYKGKVELIRGTNIGCENSFAELLKYYNDADYYAFCDQDDYWMPKKLISEVEAIKAIEGPALVACNLFLCDEQLNIKGPLHSKKDIKSIRNNMKNNYLCNMHGCVLMWNRNLHERLCNNVPGEIVSHDGWVNTVANAIGTVVVLEEPLIKYRIHSNNTAGHASGIIERAKKGIRIYLGKNHPRRDLIAKEILNRFASDMDHESNGYDTLVKIANYKRSCKDKVKLIRKDIIKKSKFPDIMLWIICVLMETY